MNFFKKPRVALVLTVLLVWLATSVSIGAKLGNKCRDISNGFYDGVKIDGVDYAPVYDSVRELCYVSNDMIVIAKNYGIDTEELYYAQDGVESAISYSQDDIAYIGWCYDDFIEQLRLMENQLHSTGLSQRHTTAMEEYSQQISAETAAIEQNAAAYNETVKQFMRQYDKFPTDFWVEVTGISFPGYFGNM